MQGARLIAIEDVRIYEKIFSSKTVSENGWWEDAYLSSYPPEPAPGHKLQKPSKESGIFQSLGTISFILVSERQSRKGGGGGGLWHNGSFLNTLLLAAFPYLVVVDGWPATLKRALNSAFLVIGG